MVLRAIEQKIEALFEGVFGRAFRTNVQPVGVEREVAVLSWDGQTRRVDQRRVVLGRSRECDIQVEDANVSRRHAELRQEGTAYWIVDLESTNGIEVNGKRVKRAKLEPGDTFTVGSTEVSFSTEHE